MKHVAERLQSLSPIITEICQISGNAGMSLGVINRGEVVHRANFGYRDLKNKIAPDSNTIYPICSLTKAMTAAAYGILVDREDFQWETPIKEIYPFQQVNERVREEANVTDLLAHRTGLAAKNLYWHQSWQQLLLPKEETASTMSILECVGTLHDSFVYNDMAYAFAGVVLEKLTGESFGSFMQTQVFEPLGLNRTTIGSPPSENIAKSYSSLDDGSPWEIPNPGIQDSTILGSSAGGKSSVNDLLKYYKAFLVAAKHQIEHNCSSTPGSPFRQAAKMVQNHVDVTSPGPHPQSYGLGWTVTELPSTLGLIGLNTRELGKDMPIIGRSTKTQSRVWYHNGSLPEAFCSAYLLLDSDAVIVVLSNSLGLTDAPDWVGQLLVESILGETNPHDFVELAKRTRKTHLRQYPRLDMKMYRDRSLDSPMKPPKAYTGRYENSIGTFKIDVAISGLSLRMWCQGYESVDYELDHHDHDIFTWEVIRNEDIKRAMFPRWYEGFHIIKFLANADGQIDRLSWGHDEAVPQGEVFRKFQDTPLVS